MKKIFNKLTIMFSMLVFLACTDDSLDPFRFNELQKGILLALRGDAFDNLNDSGCSNSFFYNNVLADDTFTYEVEFLSEDQDLLQEVRVFALTIPTTPGKAAKARQQLTVVPGSAFTIASGAAHKTGTISVTLASIVSALGLTTTEIENLSRTELTVEADIILTDGRTIASSQIVNSGLYESAIFYPAQKLSYCALDVNDAKPVASVQLRGAVVKNADGETTARPVRPLKDGASDTLYIKFDQRIITKPTVTLSPNQGTLSNGGVVQTSKEIDEDGNYTDKDDPTAFFIIYTAPAGYTGVVKATVAGANSTDSGVDLTQNPKSININVDNEDPIVVSASTGDVIGRSQFNEIEVIFNEAIVTAPLITVSGQGLDGVTDQKMTIDSKNAKRVSYIFIYKDSDSPTDATHGDLTVTISGGKDGAGNAHADVTPALLCDIGTPPPPAVDVAGLPDGGAYDYGTQIRWNVDQNNDPTAPVAATPSTAAPVGNPGGSTEGTVYYVALKTGDPAPTQKTKTVAGVKVNDGFTIDAAATVVGEGQTEIGDAVFADFAANGDLDVYFYFVSSTGNVSPITTVPLTVSMFSN